MLMVFFMLLYFAVAGACLYFFFIQPKRFFEPESVHSIPAPIPSASFLTEAANHHG